MRRKGWAARLGTVVILALAARAAHAQTLATLVSFTGPNGASPTGDLTLSGTTLYGMTSDLGPGGDGTIFSLPLGGGPATTLVSFSGLNGANPFGSLTLNGSTFYGMTANGGTADSGTVFSIPVAGGPLKTLYSFDYDVYGAYPNDSVTVSGSTLYGLASKGGVNDSGTIIKLPAAGGAVTNLYTFSDGNDGGYPYGSLIASGSFLYGMTSDGGVNGGTVFRIPASGGPITTLLSFASSNANPTGSLSLGGSTLFGLTAGGGTSDLGAVFSLPLGGGAATALFSFNGANGSSPAGSLLLSGSTLYGTTNDGGSKNLGTVFKINTNGTGFQTLLSFSGSNGANPDGSLILNGSTLYGTTEFGGSSGSGTVFALNITPATIVLSTASSATIISGGTAQLGMTVANAASSGYNLNYTLGAAVQSGSAALGTISPGAGSLVPAASASCIVSASSTHIGTNTISLTAMDPNASNSPQSIAATLNVLDHAAPSASVTDGNAFVAHAGTTGLTATIALANSSGTRSDLEVRSAALASGTLAGGPAPTYWISAGSSESYTATFSAGTTAGAFSDTASFTAGDRQTLPGAGAIGSLSATITGSVFSGSAAWTSTSGSAWSGGNWTDTSAASVHAAPGTFVGFTSTDTAAFSGSGTVTTISLSGANPSLAALSFSGPNYMLTDGTLTLNSASGTATLTVSGDTQAISSAIAGASLLLVQGAGRLVLSGSNTFSGGAVVTGGRLVVANPYSLPNGANLTIGDPGAFTGTMPVNGHWITAGGGSWSSTANWDSNGVPGYTLQDAATFGSVIGSKSATITLDGSRTLGSLTFATTGGGRYTLSRAGSDSTSALIMSGLAGAAALVDSGGSQTIAAPLVLGGKLNVTISTSAALAISGPISQSGGSQSLSLSGGGTLVLSGSNTFSGGAVVTGGRLIVAAPYSLLDGANLTVGNAGAFPGPIFAGNSSNTQAATVPEPATLAFLVTVLLSLLCRRARRGTEKKTAP